MQFSAEQIATLLQGRVEGDSQTVVTQLAKLEESNASSLTFLANPQYEHFIYEISACIFVIYEVLILQMPVH